MLPRSRWSSHAWLTRKLPESLARVDQPTLQDCPDRSGDSGRDQPQPIAQPGIMTCVPSARRTPPTASALRAAACRWHCAAGKARSTTGAAGTPASMRSRNADSSASRDSRGATTNAISRVIPACASSGMKNTPSSTPSMALSCWFEIGERCALAGDVHQVGSCGRAARRCAHLRARPHRVNTASV